MPKSYKRIKILNDHEINLLYSLPNFSFDDQIIFFSLNDMEQKIIDEISDFATKVHFILQLGYFKAKKKFFKYNLNDVKTDIKFIIKQHFPKAKPFNALLHKAKTVQNNEKILRLLSHKEFNKATKTLLAEHAIILARRHICHIDIFRELISYIETQKIVLPEYTVMQDIVTLAMTVEQKRLDNKLNHALTPQLNEFLEKMLNTDTPLGLHSFKKIPKNFCYHAIKNETAKSAELKELYLFTKGFLPSLEISKNNIKYYATVAEEYSISHLKKLKLSTAKLYLLCYLHYRYQQINDNLIISFMYYANKINTEASIYAEEQFIAYSTKQHNNLSKVSSLLRFMGKEETDKVPYHEFHQQAYAILPKIECMPAANYLDGESFDHETAKWIFYSRSRNRIKKYFRPLLRQLDLTCDEADWSIIAAIKLLQQELNKENVSLSKLKTDKFPTGFIAKNKMKYLNSDGILDHSKYEIYTYLFIANAIGREEVYCEESTKYKSLKSDLVPDAKWINKEFILQEVAYPNINTEIKARLESLEKELHEKILEVNERIAKNENKDFKIKHQKKKVTWFLLYQSVSEEMNHPFFEQLPSINLSDLVYFVDQETKFLDSFTHLRSKYVKDDVSKEALIACIMSNGLGFGKYKMAQTSDMSIATLSSAERNRIRIETLREANDVVVNKLSKLKIFNYWRIIDDKLFSGVDGQKYQTRLKSIESRYSPKYFGLKQGIVAYTLQTNHAPINTKIIGANEHESHFLFDILFNNTSDIDPDIITGDMHSINSLNYAILDSINKLFVPNFNDAASEVISSFKPLKTYENCVIKPKKLINKELIESEWSNIQRIFVSLVLQETSQSTVVRKLSSSKKSNRTRKALIEYNEIFKSLHLLNFINDSVFRSYIRKALNRTEAYHQLRRGISKVGGGLFKNASPTENEIWNHSARLLGNCIIYYNAILLEKTLDLITIENENGNIGSCNGDDIKRISPVAWQHINMIGKYEFTREKTEPDIEKMASELHQALKNKKIPR